MLRHSCFLIIEARNDAASVPDVPIHDNVRYMGGGREGTKARRHGGTEARRHGDTEALRAAPHLGSTAIYSSRLRRKTRARRQEHAGWSLED